MLMTLLKIYKYTMSLLDIDIVSHIDKSVISLKSKNNMLHKTDGGTTLKSLILLIACQITKNCMLL